MTSEGDPSFSRLKGEDGGRYHRLNTWNAMQTYHDLVELARICADNACATRSREPPKNCGGWRASIRRRPPYLVTKGSTLASRRLGSNRLPQLKGVARHLTLFREQGARRYAGDAGAGLWKYPSRSIVRRPDGEQHYLVWDTETGKVAVCEFRECRDLSFEDAFKTVDRLNGHDT